MTCRRVEQFSQRASRGGCDLSQAANIARRRALRFETNRSTRSAAADCLAMLGAVINLFLMAASF
jgi:hypothetical protein